MVIDHGKRVSAQNLTIDTFTTSAMSYIVLAQGGLHAEAKLYDMAMVLIPFLCSSANHGHLKRHA